MTKSQSTACTLEHSKGKMPSAALEKARQSRLQSYRGYNAKRTPEALEIESNLKYNAYNPLSS